MSARTFALLVGIDDYQEPVRKLTGCINDIDHYEAHLRRGSDAKNLALQVLKNGDATRANVIAQFRQHLGRAEAGDVALFVYCGHGAQSAAADEFREFDLSGKDEGLVCADSRLEGGHDLADKELAVLIDELARREAHVAFILDACHSGSGTRSVDHFSGLRSRMTTGQSAKRPLASYLDGHYAQLQKKGQRLTIPSGRHILMAACDRRQEAKESPTENRGVFSATLLEVLESAGKDLTYADVFLRCRAAVRKRASDQDPQFEPVGQFDPWGGFLGRQGGSAGRTFQVSFDRKAWRINCGAIHGMPTDPDKPVGVAIYGDSETDPVAATAQTIEVGTQDAIVDLGDFKADPGKTYRAAVTSLPVAPLLVHFAKDAPGRAAVERAMASDQAIGVALTEVADGTRYGFEVQGSQLRFVQRESGILVQAADGAAGHFDVAAKGLLGVVKQVAQWERSLLLQNSATQLDASAFEFVCVEPVEGQPDHIHLGSAVTLESVNERGEWSSILAKLKLRSGSKKAMNWALMYFSAAYGIDELARGTIEPGDEFQTVFAPRRGFHMERDEVAESVDRFKLIVSTQPIDGFLLMQKDLKLGGMVPVTRAFDRDDADEATPKARQDDWLTKDLIVRVVPRLDVVGLQDWAPENLPIVVKGHPTLTATVSMSPARSATRAAGQSAAFIDAFARAGLKLPSFSNTRGESLNVLELNGIEGGESLREHPLEIEVNLPLDAGETLLPFVFDGEHVMLGGRASQDDAGHTHISIDRLPEPAINSRSLTGSLKLYFFKTYLKRSDVNLLRWVDYAADGSFKQREDGIAERVAAARRVLLLVHGIIGDTEGMAGGVRECGLTGPIDPNFDLVLTFDYENLKTSIQETARDLKARLAEAGLTAGDDKHLTLLVHSMGGLVSRWFIEREGGNRMVDHLVMCGTPNHGSPFGRIDEARQILTLLTGLAANYVPAMLPFSGPMLLLLNRSKKVTETLMQMDPGSEFIRSLNDSPDPGIPYTILAGDIDKYDEPTDKGFKDLIKKVGTSALFDALFANKANDIAVAIDSIERVGPARATAPKTSQVACHHLNYFVSHAGQQALKSVAW